MANKISQTIVYLPLRNLQLDPQNPRFAGLNIKSQKDIVKFLWNEMALEEVLISIAVNGYYWYEPILVIKEGNAYTVVEGNRRLASVLLLLENDLVKYVGASKDQIPKLNNTDKEKLKSLPTIEFSSRRDLWSYLSFRHVNGQRTWSAVSKAEFIANLYEKEKISFDDILSYTGDTNKTSVRLYNGLIVLRQGEKQTKFTREDFNASKFNFSHLYTIIQYPNTKKFLGIEKHDFSRPFPKDLVPRRNNKELEELLFWIFGSKSFGWTSLIQSQNPDLKMLDDILGDKDAVGYLRDNKNLIEAHEYTNEEDRRLENYIMRAETNIRKAKSFEDFYKGDQDLLKRVTVIHSISSEMLNKMDKFGKKNK